MDGLDPMKAFNPKPKNGLKEVVIITTTATAR
jgi:hypothetical protein